MLRLLFLCLFSNPFQMYSTQVKKKCTEHFSSIILAAQVLSLGLWHARPHFWYQCGYNSPTSRYDIVHHSHINIQKRDGSVLQKSFCHAQLRFFVKTSTVLVAHFS